MPRVVRPRGLHEPHLADDLRPQVERGAGVTPRVEGKCGPRGGALDWPIHAALASIPRLRTRQGLAGGLTNKRLVDYASGSRMLAHLGLLQERIARLVPDQEALVWGGGTLTHAQLAARSRRIANAVRALGLGTRIERDAPAAVGVGPGPRRPLPLQRPRVDRVDVRRVLKARAAFVNVNYRYKAEELRYVLDNGAARAIIYHAAFAPTLAAVRDQLARARAPDPGPRRLERAAAAGRGRLRDVGRRRRRHAARICRTPPDDLYVLFTGGTTGLPKGVLWRHEDVFYNGLGGHLPGFTAPRDRGAATRPREPRHRRSLARVPAVHARRRAVERRSTRSIAAARSCCPTSCAGSTRTRCGAPSSGIAATP